MAVPPKKPSVDVDFAALETAALAKVTPLTPEQKTELEKVFKQPKFLSGSAASKYWGVSVDSPNPEKLSSVTLHPLKGVDLAEYESVHGQVAPGTLVYYNDGKYFTYPASNVYYSNEALHVVSQPWTWTKQWKEVKYEQSEWSEAEWKAAFEAVAVPAKKPAKPNIQNLPYAGENVLDKHVVWDAWLSEESMSVKMTDKITEQYLANAYAAIAQYSRKPIEGSAPAVQGDGWYGLVLDVLAVV